MKIKKINIRNILFFTLISLSMLMAGDILFRGRIYDGQSGLPLMGADVYLLRAGKGTVAGNKGWFSLQITSADLGDTLVISYLGYQEQRIPLRSYQDGTPIRLNPKSLEFGERIEVSAERINLIKQDIPHSRSTLDLQEIRQYGGNEISDILKTVPSVQMEGNDLDGRKIQIRGSDPDEVKVYLDGVLINNARFDNTADLSIIPLESIENLEVLKGGNLAFLGSGAFGGVVSVTTRQVNDFQVRLKSKFGSYDSRHFLGELDLPLHRRFTMNYYGQFSQWAPEIEFFPSERFTEKSLNRQINIQKQNHLLNLNYFIPGGSLNAKFIGYFLDYEKPQWTSRYHNFLDVLSYKGNLLSQKDFELTVSHLYTSDKIERSPAGTSRYVNQYLSNQLNTRLTKKFMYRALEMQFLGEYFHEDLQAFSRILDVNREETFYDALLYDNRLSTAAVFSFEDKVTKIPALTWKTFIGTRGDFLASGQTDWTHMVGAQLTYRIEHWNLSPYFNWGNNVKYPSLQENAYVQDVVDFTRSDSLVRRLQPEYNQSAEIGMMATYYPFQSIYQNAELSFSLFTRTVHNKLLRRPFDDIIATTQLGRSVTRGLESAVNLNGLFNRASLSLSYIQLDITDPLIYAYKPDKKLSLHLLYNSSLGIYMTTTAFYEGKSIGWFYDTRDNLQTLEISPFADMDVSFGAKIRIRNIDFDLQFSGHNILDNSSFTYYYLKKRYLQLSLSFTY